MNTMRMRNTAGSVLALVMTVLAIVGLIGASFMQRVVRGTRTAAWSRDHLALQLLAESAAEEIFASLSEQANTAGNPVHAALRGARPDAEVVLSIGTPLVDEDAQARASALGGPVQLTSSVKLIKTVAVSGDAGEVVGVVRTEVQVRVARARQPLVERVRIDRSFQIARTVLPPPLDQMALFVVRPDHRRLPREPMYAPLADDDRTLLAMLTKPAPLGFQKVPAEVLQGVTAALGTFTPDALARRAQFVTRSVRELEIFFEERLERGRPINGLIYNNSPELVDISVEKFRGRALLCVPGPVRVGECSMEEPGRDSLTIVSGGRMLVTGRNVEANLITLDPAAGLVFAQQSRVAGCVISSRFPRSTGISPREMQQCEFGTFAGLAVSDPLTAYFVVFSPQPVSTEHLREGEEWSAW